MSEQQFEFEWGEITIKSVTIEATSKQEALKKWDNGDYDTSRIDSQEIIGDVVTIDGEDYRVEQMYYIKLSEHQYAQRFDGDNLDLVLVNDEAFAGLFTEQEIKKINPNLMTLAVEVTK